MARKEILAGRVYAAEQLNTAIDWRRYTELFAYDDNTEELFLEEDEFAK